jgi:hypothetical protein
MDKTVVGSLSLPQPLLLYSSLGPAMLDNIGGVKELIGTMKRYCKANRGAAIFLQAIFTRLN